MEHADSILNKTFWDVGNNNNKKWCIKNPIWPPLSWKTCTWLYMNKCSFSNFYPWMILRYENFFQQMKLLSPHYKLPLFPVVFLLLYIILLSPWISGHLCWKMLILPFTSLSWTSICVKSTVSYTNTHLSLSDTYLWKCHINWTNLTNQWQTIMDGH